MGSCLGSLTTLLHLEFATSENTTESMLAEEERHRIGQLQLTTVRMMQLLELSVYKVI